MKMVLSRLGYVVTCVTTGHEALIALSHTNFALALLALHLPDLPGLTLARRLRGTPGPVGAMPIILFGDAWDPERILESCREARLEGYLPKPISIGRLVSSIHDLIHRPPQDAGIAMPDPSPAPDRPRAAGLVHRRRPRSSSASWARSIWRRPTLYLERDAAALAAGGDWSQPVHALKGASANIGASELARLAAERSTRAAVARRRLRRDRARRCARRARRSSASPARQSTPRARRAGGPVVGTPPQFAQDLRFCHKALDPPISFALLSRRGS